MNPVLVAAATLLAPGVESPVPLPEDPESLDPAVLELVRSHAASASAAPENAEALGTLGLVYEANLLWEEARLCLERAAELAPDAPGWRLHLAIALRHTGETALALQAIEQVAASEPGAPAAHQRRGLWLLEAGDISGAEAAFRALIDVAPEAGAGYTGLGEVLLERGDLAGAVEQLQRALERDPDDPSAHYLLGRAYRALGRDEDARRELARGIGAKTALLPDEHSPRVAEFAVNAASRLDRAERLLSDRRPREAAALLEAVLKHDPENVVALNKLAIAQIDQGAPGAARRTLERAVELDETAASTHLNLAVWAVRSRLWADALEHADAAVRHAPQLAQAHRTRGTILIRMGELGDATESLETALALDPRDPELHLMLADTYARSSRPTLALARSRSAAVTWPERLDVQLAQARLSLRLGDGPGAQKALEAARALAPDDPRLAPLEARLLELEPPS